jgi:hypothetical protein
MIPLHIHLVPVPASIKRKTQTSTKAPAQTTNQNQYKPIDGTRREVQSNEQNVLAWGSDFEPKVVTHRTTFRLTRSQHAQCDVAQRRVRAAAVLLLHQVPQWHSHLSPPRALNHTTQTSKKKPIPMGQRRLSEAGAFCEEIGCVLRVIRCAFPPYWLHR